MISCVTTYRLKTVFIGFCLAFLITACNLSSSSDDKIPPIPKLNDKNIKAFIITAAKDYEKLTRSLVSEFKAHKKSGDGYGFTKFRNHTWTPAYIKKKVYYQKVYEQNKAYLSGTKTDPIFYAFENLIYIGVNLKKSLLDDANSYLEKEALTELKKDKKNFVAVVK